MNISGPRLLLVQGDGPRRRKLLDMLEALDCQVDIDDGTDGELRAAAMDVCDVVLLDTELPGTKGHDLLVELSGHRNEVPVIVVCKRELMTDALDALRHGACDYIKLPVEEPSVLQHALRRALQQTLLKRENLAYRTKLENTNRELLDSLTLLQTDQQAGRHIQMRMLPDTPMRIGSLTFERRVVPSLYLSGDFVEYFRVGNKHAAFFIADVSGHGASSAFVTVMLKNLFARKRSRYIHDGVEDIFSPAAMLQCANDELLEMQIGKHVTMVVGIIDTESGRGSLGVAGHLPAPIRAEGGVADYLEGEGVAVGLFEDAEFSEFSFDLNAGGVLTAFSDGILEVLPGDGLQAKESLLIEKLAPGYASVDEARDALELEEVYEFPDDIAVLIISRDP